MIDIGLRQGEPQDDYVVECFWPGVSVADIDELALRARRAVRSMQVRGIRVRYTGAVLVPRDEVALFEFRAASRDDVAEASTRAGIPFQRIVLAVRRSHER